MVANLIITAATEEVAERRARKHLKDEGWLDKRFDHIELVTEAPMHDFRMGLLYQSAQGDGIAALFSPYV